MTRFISTHRPAYTLLFIIIAACVFTAFTRPGEPSKGKTLFERHCIRCHGPNGAKGFLGAANLKKSIMTEEAIVERIENGKKFMPSFKKRFTREEIKELAAYVKNLRAS